MEIGIKVDLETHEEHEHMNIIKLKVNNRKSLLCVLILFENLDP